MSGYQGTPEWIAERRGGFGASDAPTLILGDEREWNELMLRKLNILPERETTESMELGKELERPIRNLAARRLGEEIISVNRILRHAEHDEVRASLDGVRRRGRRPVEIKRWGWRSDDFGPNGKDIVPDRMNYQVQQILAVTGHEVADLFVLFPDELALFQIGRDEPTIEDIVSLEVAAFEYIRRGEVPPWPGPAPERPRLKADEIAADEELLELVWRHDLAQLHYNAAEAELNEVKGLLRDRLVDVGGTRGELPDGRRFSVTHRPNRSSQVTGWEEVAVGYRKRLLELGVPEADLDFTTNALTVTRAGARPLRVTVAKPKEQAAA